MQWKKLIFRFSLTQYIAFVLAVTIVGLSIHALKTVQLDGDERILGAHVGSMGLVDTLFIQNTKTVVIEDNQGNIHKLLGTDWRPNFNQFVGTLTSWVVVQFFGNSPYNLRIPSIFFLILFLAICFWYLRGWELVLLFSHLALNQVFIIYCSTFKGYASAIAFTFLFYVLLKKSDSKTAFLIGIVACFTHTFAAIFVAITAVAHFLHTRSYLNLFLIPLCSFLVFLHMQQMRAIGDFGSMSLLPAFQAFGVVNFLWIVVVVFLYGFLLKMFRERDLDWYFLFLFVSLFSISFLIFQPSINFGRYFLPFIPVFFLIIFRTKSIITILVLFFLLPALNIKSVYSRQIHNNPRWTGYDEIFSKMRTFVTDSDCIATFKNKDMHSFMVTGLYFTPNAINQGRTCDHTYLVVLLNPSLVPVRIAMSPLRFYEKPKTIFSNDSGVVLLLKNYGPVFKRSVLR